MTVGIKRNKNAIVWRIEGLRETPPELTMLVNPTNLTLNYQPLINETRTRGGFIQEFWGEQLTSLSATGRTAMFYDDDGITNRNSRATESYAEFIRLVNIYKNNGKDYTNETTLASKANPNRISSYGSVIMTYMNSQHKGYFENFVFKEDATKPFYFEYDFNFKIISTIGEFIVEDGRFILETE